MNRAALFLLLLNACVTSPEEHPEDTSSGKIDSGNITETGETGDTQDTGEPSLTVFPEIDGDCGVLDVELTDTNSHSFSNSIDFGTVGFEEEYLSEGGQRILETSNAGGSSIYSEVFAYELLFRCESASLLKTETEITYTDSQGKITDLLVEIEDAKIGVSVTRAFAYPPETPYTTDMATELLGKKLNGILESSANVSPEDAWEKQVLHVLAYTSDHQATVLQSFDSLEPGIKADTILVVTNTEGLDDFLY